MDTTKRRLGASLHNLRYQHPAWLLLASPIAPYVLTCLQRLFEPGTENRIEDMEQALSEMLETYASDDELEADSRQQARREIQSWIRRRLVTERGGVLFATDELQLVMRFVEGLQDRIMTSTASRLATVQRQIADLAMQLSPDAAAREQRLIEQIAALEAELEQVRSGQFDVRSGDSAIEGIRDVFDLAISLVSDFRRVEDSYRDAERQLRQTLISDEQHRGQAVDSLLDSHDQLLETPEGQVFSVFHQQLLESGDLDRMRHQLREIARHELVSQALSHKQRDDLALLVINLITDSQRVIQARSRSERDVKGFIRSGLAREHFVVGRRLNELFDVAQRIDWSRQTLRRSLTSLPVIAGNIGNVPLIERLRFKGSDEEPYNDLDLTPVRQDVTAFDSDFWSGFDSLDRQNLYETTLALLSDHGPLTVGAIMSKLDTTHDLEAVAYLLGLACEVEAGHDTPVLAHENFSTASGDKSSPFEFTIPRMLLSADAIRQISWEVA